MFKMSARAMAVVGFGLLLLTGCAHQQTPKVDNTERPFRIGREDVLDIAVWRDADLSRVLPARPDGFITMTMAGEVMAAGKTPTELEQEIKSKLSPFVQEPRVTVIVREVNSSRVFVTGEVTHPGVYPLRGRVSLLRPAKNASRTTPMTSASTARASGPAIRTFPTADSPGHKDSATWRVTMTLRRALVS